MKLLTLNTHSWLEEQAEEKLQQLASVILAADYDVITLQEVNQLIGGEKATLNCWYCPNNDTTEILSDNFALALVEILQEQGQFYYWTWAMSHIGYGNLPLINRIKIRDTEQKHWKSLLNSLEANPFQSLLYRQNQITTMHYAYIRNLALL